MLKLVSFVLKFYPVILVLIEVVEVFGAGKSGAEKKAVVLKVAQELAGRFGLRLTSAHITMLSDVIDALVSVLNTIGIFKKDAPLDEEEVVVPAAPAVATNDAKLDELEAILVR